MSQPQEGQRWLGATLYPIDGLEQTSIAFRVLRVREAMPQDSLRATRVQRMADHLWRGVLKTAVAPTMRFGGPGFLVPDSPKVVPGTSLELMDVPDQLYHVDITNELHTVHFNTAKGAERELVCRTLERAFTDQLISLGDQFWRETWTTFYPRDAANEATTADRVRAFRGVRFGVVLMNGEPFLAADVRTRYLGRKSLAETSSGERQTLLSQHLGGSKIDRRALFVRDNGARKFSCRYADDTGHTVAEHTFESQGRRQSVLEYYQERYPKLPLSPTDRAVYVQDRKGGQSLAVPASRLFPVFTTEDDAIRRCSVPPTLPPAERQLVIAGVLPKLAGTSFGDQRLTPRLAPWKVTRTVFSPPSLEFGGNTVITAFDGSGPPASTTERFDRGVLTIGERKTKAVDTKRPFHNEPLPDILLFYPDNFSREVRERFMAVLRENIRGLSGQELQVRQQLSYATGKGEREGRDLLKRLGQAVPSSNGGMALIVLAESLGPDVHGDIKLALHASHSQCVSEKRAKEIGTGSPSGRLKGLVRNLTLAILTEAGVKPWVLADPLHHDVHIGIDLLHGRIGYHALYGRGGRYVSTDFGTALHAGRMREQIKRPELKQRMEGILRGIASSKERVDTLVIHRDGRWWPSEDDGLREAVDTLVTDGTLPSTFRYVVAEVRKNHLPVRLFTIDESHSPSRLMNPLPGSFHLLDGERALLATTGRPGSWDGSAGRTASTLLLEVVAARGAYDLVNIVEDAYRLTHLNWNAPDIAIALPVTIRWTDRILREPLRGTRRDRGASAEEVA